ncbi:MAG: hypothetical protein AB1758_32185, partial [Candidatus Eremiobacterota bacterium]
VLVGSALWGWSSSERPEPGPTPRPAPPLRASAGVAVLEWSRPQAPTPAAPAAPEPSRRTRGQDFERSWYLEDPHRQSTTIDGFWLGMQRSDVEAYVGSPDDEEPRTTAEDTRNRRVGWTRRCHYGDLVVWYFQPKGDPWDQVVVLLEGTALAHKGRDITSEAEADAVLGCRGRGPAHATHAWYGSYIHVEFDPQTRRVRRASHCTSSGY